MSAPSPAPRPNPSDPDRPDEIPLSGGVANAGAVVRVGDHVLRPASAHTASIHRFLRHLRDGGFDGAPEPVGVDPDGRERLRWVDGDVALPPYPAWVQRDEALCSIARLLRRMHDAAAGFDPADGTWSPEMADPSGGPIVGHNDVCLENVVFRDGVAVALLDFDFAAPARPGYDLAACVRMCGPIDDDVNAARQGWAVHPGGAAAGRQRRLRMAADAYGLDDTGRAELLTHLDHAMTHGGEFVRRRVEAGDANFVRMWNDMGGAGRYERRRRWWESERPSFQTALAGPA